MAVLLGTTACGTRTEPADAPATQPGHALPWLADGMLHDGDVTVPTRADRLAVSAGTTFVGRTGQHRSRWWVLDRDHLVLVLDEPAAYTEPVLSADGGTAAWRSELSSDPTGDLTVDQKWGITAYDVPTRTVLGTTTVTRQVRCCDQGGAPVVTVVANDGRVALTDGGDELLMWRAGDDPVPASWRDFGGRLPDGAVRSPDETLAAGPGPEVRDVRTGERTALRLPDDDRRWTVRMWADDTHVLVSRGNDVISCDVSTGECVPDRSA
jgi:hypothetical protein